MPKILIVEDDDLVRMALRKFFETAGFVVLEAECGVSGLEAYRDGNPDLVVTDIMMPEMDGLTFITELKSIHPDAKILACSGEIPTTTNSHYNGIVQAIGVENFYWKPVVPSELLDAANKHLSS